MKEITLGTKRINFAERWAETSMDQKVALLPLQLLDPEDPGQAAVLKFTAAQILLGKPKEIELLDTAQRWRLMRLAGWVLSTRIQEKPFESFTFQGEEYFLPDPDYANTSAVEVAFLNIHFMAIGRKVNPDPKAIFSLLATICRPKRKDLKSFKASLKWNGDIREPYNGVTVEARAALFAKLPLGLAMAVLQYFEHMNGRFLTAYAKAYEGDPEDAGEVPLYTDGRGLITTFMDIAKANVFGPFEAVCETNAHTVWTYLVDNNLKIQRANRRAREREEE